MKRIIKSMTVAAALAMVFAGCHRDGIGFDSNGGNNPSAENGIGYISFAAGGLNVEWSGENVTSRAGAEDFNDWTVEVHRVTPTAEKLDEMTYEEFNAEPYGLVVSTATEGSAPDTYKLVMYSAEMTADAEWNKPTYRGETDGFTVALTDTPEKPKQIDITCRLETIKVSVWLEKSMAELLADEYSIEVVVSDPANVEEPESLTYGTDYNYGVANLAEDTHAWESMVEEADCAYFKPVVTDNAVTLNLDLKYGEKKIKQELPICFGDKLAHAGEHRRVLLYIEESETATGNIIVNAVIQTWVWGKEVNVMVDEVLSSAFSREPGGIIDSDDDPEAPVFDGAYKFVDGVASVSVSDADYDFGEYTPDAKVTITAVNDIKSFAVAVSSTDGAYQAALESAGLADGTAIDIMSGTFVTRAESEAAALVSGYGFRKAGVQGKQAQFKLGGFFEALAEKEYTGEHTITMYVEDVAGHKSTAVLVATNGGGNGPTITWPGHDFNTRYEIVDDMKVDIHIEAPAGIAHFYVTMSGSIADALNGDLPEHFDLVEPEKYQEGLTGALTSPLIGFPVGDDVLGETSMLFDISKFMGMLKGVTDGPSDFTLKIEDANGDFAEVTLKLNVTK